MKEKLVCYLDGDSLCIVRKDFVDLQESRSVFVDLDSDELKEIQGLENE